MKYEIQNVQHPTGLDRIVMGSQCVGGGGLDRVFTVCQVGFNLCLGLCSKCRQS